MKKNFGIKILVIIIALLLWFQQQLLKNQTVEIPVQIDYKNVPEDLIIMPESAQTVLINLTGRGLDILFYKLSKPRVSIDASQFRYGKNAIELHKQELFMGENGLELNQLGLNETNWATTDRLVEKEKPVKVVYASTKEEEFFLENKILDENLKAKIIGPLSLVNEIPFVETEKISKKMVRDGFLKVELVKPDELIDLKDKEITLQILQSRIINKTISLIPVQFPLEQNVTIIPQKVTVMVRGPEDVVDKLNQQSIKASITLDSSKRNDFVDIQFDLPSGVKLIDHTPQKIQVIRND
jgi:hypothetical protein